MKNFPSKCTRKAYAEGVAESMRSVIDSHSDKRRRDGKGIHYTLEWKPLVHLADNLGKKSLNRLLRDRPRHLVTKFRALESTVLKSVYQQTSRVPFF